MNTKLHRCEGCLSKYFDNLECIKNDKTYTTMCNRCKPTVLKIVKIHNISNFEIITEEEYFRYMELNKIL